MCVKPYHVHIIQHPSYDKDDEDMFEENSIAKYVDDDENHEMNIFLQIVIMWEQDYCERMCIFCSKTMINDYFKKISFY